MTANYNVCSNFNNLNKKFFFWKPVKNFKSQISVLS